MTSFESIMRSANNHLPMAEFRAGQVRVPARTVGARLTLIGGIQCRPTMITLEKSLSYSAGFPSSGTVPVRGGADPDTRTLGIIQLAILNRIKAKPEYSTAREITDDLSKLFGERIPDAQVFVTLARLRDRGLVEAVTPTSNESEELNEKQRGLSPGPRIARLSTTRTSRGRRAAIMKLTPLGVEAVEQAARILLESATTP